jgi:hypothetical protein
VRSTVAVVALIGILSLSACSGSGHGGRKSGPSSPGARAEPVAAQLRDVLGGAFRPNAGLGVVQRRGTPLADVKVCTGPANGGAGSYRCSLRPHRSWIPRSVTVSVDRHGTWRTATIYDDRAAHAFWGIGLVLPSR